MSSVAIDSSCSLGGTLQVDGDVTLHSKLDVTDVSTHSDDIVLKNGGTTTVTFAKEGRIGLGRRRRRGEVGQLTNSTGLGFRVPGGGFRH